MIDLDKTTVARASNPRNQLAQRRLAANWRRAASCFNCPRYAQNYCALLRGSTKSNWICDRYAAKEEQL
jgi:hypothetical protein